MNLRSCSTRTNVVRFLSGTWFLGAFDFGTNKKALEVVSNIYVSYVSCSPLVGKILKFTNGIIFSRGLSTNRLKKFCFSPNEIDTNAMFLKKKKNAMPSKYPGYMLCIVGASIIGFIWGQGNMPPYWNTLTLSRLFLPPFRPALLDPWDLKHNRNLKRIARDLGEKLTDEELRGMIDVAWCMDCGNSGVCVEWYRVK